MTSPPPRSRAARAVRAALVTTIVLVVVQVVVLLAPSSPAVPGAARLADLGPTRGEVAMAMATPFVGFAVLTVLFLVGLVLVDGAAALLARGRGRPRHRHRA